jgi:hypothetical protein
MGNLSLFHLPEVRPSDTALSGEQRIESRQTNPHKAGIALGQPGNGVR